MYMIFICSEWVGGSGFIIDNTGLVITTVFAAGSEETVKFVTSDGREFGASILAIDPVSYMAIVHVVP